MIESPNPVAMRVSLYSTHTRLQTTECEAFLPSHVSEGACTSGGHTTCHPLLMDERHYSSWGQVPPTIKGPSQWLRKHGGGGNCCCRTDKHKRCKRNQTAEKGGWGFFANTKSREERPHIAGVESPELLYACKNTPFHSDMSRLWNTWLLKWIITEGQHYFMAFNGSSETHFYY